MPNVYPQSRAAGFPPMEELGPSVYHQDPHAGWQGGMRNDQVPPSSLQGPPASAGFIPPSSGMAVQGGVGPEFHPSLQSGTPADPQDGKSTSLELHEMQTLMMLLYLVGNDDRTCNVDTCGVTLSYVWQ